MKQAINEKQQQLIQQFLTVRDTEDYQIRAENGEKTAEEFAGQFLYVYGEQALIQFQKEGRGLEENFFEEIETFLK